MSQQLTLSFADACQAVAGPQRSPGRQAFLDFHKANPRVYRLFREYAHRARQQGFTRYSARAIIERIRWHEQVERGNRDFKINDHCTPYYARLLIWQDPSFEGFFELRKAEADQ